MSKSIEVIAVSGAREVGRFALAAGAYTLGRSSSCDLKIVGEGVSRQHARLTIEAEGGLLLEDLQSANGTWVDGEQIAGKVVLTSGQEVRLGATALLLHTGLTHHEIEGLGDGAGIDLPPEFYRRDRYDVGDELAKGGMGAILQAREATTRRTVAMKVILGEAEESARHRLRFIEEAQITAQLEHPNIVPVHELGADSRGRVFYTMKLVQGITLKKVFELLQKGTPQTVEKYPLSTLLTIFQKICDALAFSHSKGVIHRDLKPANIMLGHFGEVLVMDWGLAKMLGQKPAAPDEDAATIADVQSARNEQGEEFATMEGSVMGTPQYMSPEQARGEIASLDARSDIFSLGTILYQLLTLRLPFTGKNSSEVMKKISEGAALVPPLSLNKTATKKELPHLPGHLIPASLAAVCLKALAFDKAQRYQSVRELQQDLLAYQNGFATSAEAASLSRQLRLFAQRHRKALLAGAAMLLLCGLGFAGFQYQQHRQRQQSHETLSARAAELGKAGDWDAATVELQRAQVVLDRPEGRKQLRETWLAGARADLEKTRYGAAAIKLQELLRLFPGDAAAAELMPNALGEGFISIQAPFAGEVVELLQDSNLQRIAGPAGERKVGALPVKDLRLTQGSHLFEVRREGKRWCSLPVEIKRGGHAQITIPISDIPAGYEYIQGGDFIQGDEGTVQADGSFGKRTLTLPGFFCRSTVVTGEEYFRFQSSSEYSRLITEALAAAQVSISEIQGGAQTPGDLQAFKEGMEKSEVVPVRGLSYYEAAALARWAQARLPSEEEWEKAARGVDGRFFTTGNLQPRYAEGRMATGFTRENSNASPFGCFALSDSVWQWTSSLSEPGSSRYIVKGGAGRGLATDLKPAIRRPLDPKIKYPSSGVLLVRDLPQ